MDIQTNAAAYNNVGHILKTAGQPLTASALMRHPAIAELNVNSHIVRDALVWYHRHRYIRKLPRQWTADDASRYQWEWAQVAETREVPDHSLRKRKELSSEGREAISRAAKLRWKRLRKNGHVPKHLGDKPSKAKRAVPAEMVQDSVMLVNNLLAEEKYGKIGSAFHALSGVKLTTKQVHALLEIAVLIERGV